MNPFIALGRFLQRGAGALTRKLIAALSPHKDESPPLEGKARLRPPSTAENFAAAERKLPPTIFQ